MLACAANPIAYVFAGVAVTFLFIAYTAWCVSMGAKIG